MVLREVVITHHPKCVMTLVTSPTPSTASGATPPASPSSSIWSGWLPSVPAEAKTVAYLRHWRNHANGVTTAHPSRAHTDGTIQLKEDTHVGI